MQSGTLKRYNKPRSKAATNDEEQVQQFAIIVKPDPENGGFVATVPDNPDILVHGETEEAALENARAALEPGNGEAAALGTKGTESPPRPFDIPPDLQTLADEQGVEAADDFDSLLGDFWPEDEDPDEFLVALREWRRESQDA